VTDDDFLRRWSRRKTAVREGKKVEPDPVPVQQSVAPVETGSPLEPAAPEPLPPVESLTPESDFAPFMQQGVDPGVKREALKTLLRDPRFNVMDGLDVYIDDYSKPDPMPEAWLSQLNQMKHLGHYLEPDAAEAGKEAPGADLEESGAAKKAMEEQPVAFPENEAPVDTDSNESPPPESANRPGSEGHSITAGGTLPRNEA